MRKTRAKKRITEPDPKFNDPLVTRFVNGMMYDGKKSLSLKIFYDAIDIVDRKIEDQEGIEVWRLAMNNVMPAVEVKARRVGGATFQIPMEVPQKIKIAVVIKWMINFARNIN
jgi:small subunit ribosomal protein S7